MAHEVFPVEQLSNGMDAVFVNLPHFKSHSTRIIVGSGSNHEDPNARGTAHFLEHVTFQGTEKLPSETSVHAFSEQNGLSRNAFTGKAFTVYQADGFDLKSVAELTTDLVFNPLLTAASLERERDPIIDEIRGYESGVGFKANSRHQAVIGGKDYSKFVGGTVEDVALTTHEDLTRFHERHYRLGNAILIFCSADSVEQQREQAEDLLQTVTEVGPDNPVPAVTLKFNPRNVDTSLELIDLPPSAQTNLVIDIEIPEVDDTVEQFRYAMVGTMLAKAAHRKLRSEMALCYDASAGVSIHNDRHFGRARNAGILNLNASVNGAHARTALSALYTDVLHAPLSADAFENDIRSLRRTDGMITQNDPSSVVEYVQNLLMSNKLEEVRLAGQRTYYTDQITLESLRRVHKEITDRKPLVIATSPEQSVLDSIADWTSSNIQP